MSQQPSPRSVITAIWGRTFVHPAFDYMLIGGGLSLIITLVVCVFPSALAAGYMALNTDAVANLTFLPYLILLSNSAHFSASTVRLYTKQGAYQSLPFLTMGFPLLAIAIVTFCICLADRLGPHLQALYLTWSPFHYAAQAYGLAVMYCYRSGCLLTRTDKKMLWWVAMLPFFSTFVSGQGVGLGWLLPDVFVSSVPEVSEVRTIGGNVLAGLAVVTPLLLFVKVWFSRSGTMPLISLLAVVTNGIWFIVLGPLDAFVWATIFHGVQYLAIVVIFHVKDQMSRPQNRHGTLYHVACFYSLCLLLGYCLFHIVPQAYLFAGFGQVESMLLVTAAINIHHFVVDAYIWRLKKTDANHRILESKRPASA